MAGLQQVDINMENKGVHFYVQDDDEGDASCSDASCKALGFDCCLVRENQCVNDTELRPNASTQAGYGQALAQVAQSPALYANWPEIYYICPRGTIPSGNSQEGRNGGPVPTFEELLKDYLCQEAETEEKEEEHCTPDKATVVKRIQSICGCAEGSSCPDMHFYAHKDQESKEVFDITCSDREITSSRD